MSLAYQVAKPPEGLEAYYTQQGDVFVLDVDGVVDEQTHSRTVGELKKKTDEFRDHNIALRKQVEQHKPNGDGRQIEELIEESLKTVKTSLTAAQEENRKLSVQLEEAVLSDKVKDEALKHGVFESALPDVVSRVKHVFTVKDGKPVTKTPKFRDEQGELYTIETWLKQLSKDAGHLFKGSNGSNVMRTINTHNTTSNKEMSSVDRIKSGLERLKAGETARKQI